MNPDLGITIGGAFVAGLMASLHCVGMCGPLACLACRRAGACSRTQPAALYHAGRLISYTLVGAVAGAAGLAIAGAMPPQAVRILSWIVGGAVVLAAVAWAIGWKLPAARLPKLPERWRAFPALIGLATPAIPCGPLYLMIGACALTGSGVRGAALALAFGLGTVPLLWIAQHQWERVRSWTGVRGAVLLQRSLVVLAAVVVVWRLQAGDGFAAPDCCHTGLP